MFIFQILLFLSLHYVKNTIIRHAKKQGKKENDEVKTWFMNVDEQMT